MCQTRLSWTAGIRQAGRGQASSEVGRRGSKGMMGRQGTRGGREGERERAIGGREE